MLVAENSDPLPLFLSLLLSFSLPLSLPPFACCCTFELVEERKRESERE